MNQQTSGTPGETPAAAPAAGSPAGDGAAIGAIGRKAGRGLRWSLLGNVVMKAGSFVVSLVLARLLAPEDFGVYAVALAATQFVMTVKDIGIIAATVQWRGRLAEMAPTATLLALVSATSLYGVFWLGAPAFAALAGNPDAAPVVRVLTAVILVEGFTAVRSGALMREFRHDRLSGAILAGFVANAVVAVSLAAGGAGPYSFAWGQLTGAVVTGVIVLVVARLPFRLGFDRQIAGRLLRFGLPSAAGTGLEAVLLNVGYVIVGAVLDEELLGYYLLAFNISSWVPGLIGTAIRYVSIPGFSRLAEREDETLQYGVERSVPLLVAAVLPVAVLMATLAHPLIVFLYGVKWEMSAGVLRFLAVLMLARMLTAFAFDILTSQGATKATVWMNLGCGVVLVPAILAGAHLGGIRGAAIGHAASAVLVALPLAAFALHRQGVRIAPILPALRRPLAGAAVCGAVALALAYALSLVGGNAFAELSVAGGAGLLAYVLVAIPRADLVRLGGRVTARIPARSR
jgi:Membrane protein involved in the export of O-antigen and teichoic acid